MSIRQKLIALSMVTSTFAVIFTCSWLIIFSNFEERKDLVEETRIISKIYADELSKSVALSDKTRVLNSLNTLRTRESFIQACLYTNDEEVFVQYIEKKKYGQDCKNIARSNRIYEFRKDLKGREYLLVNAYIIHKNYKLGNIIILSNLDHINNRRDRAIINSMILLSVVIIISYLISRFLQRTISEPILHLADVSYIVHRGDYHIRAKSFSNDEVGILTKAYNNMLKQVQYSKENLEEKVRERTHDLEKVMQVKSQFLSNMSHEIRTPIHGIMNYIDFLLEDWDRLTQEQKYEFVRKLQSNSGRLLSLINNLLDLSKLDAGKMEFFMEKASLVPIIKDVIQECTALFENKKQLSIIFDYEQNKDFIATFDKERIMQVIRNLLSNAIKFTNKGKIFLKLDFVKFKRNNSHKLQGIRVDIKDQGIGIPENELLYIFEKFNQSAKTKTGAGGTGLGLAISKEIISAHKGLIWATNNEDEIGSTFTFIIPTYQTRYKKVEKNV